MSFMSLTHVTPELEPLELSIQVGIMIHAIACTTLMLAMSREARPLPARDAEPLYRWSVARTMAAGLAAALIVCAAGWGVKRALYGDVVAGGFYTDHIRFGPNNTNDKP
jgi:hypothetical protein